MQGICAQLQGGSEEPQLAHSYTTRLGSQKNRRLVSVVRGNKRSPQRTQQRPAQRPAPHAWKSCHRLPSMQKNYNDFGVHMNNPHSITTVQARKARRPSPRTLHKSQLAHSNTTRLETQLHKLTMRSQTFTLLRSAQLKYAHK